MIYLGIDPGSSGGIAALRSDGTREALKMPKCERDIWTLISMFRVEYVPNSGWVPSFAVVEQVGGFVRGNPRTGSSMFAFGQNYGSVRMALIAAGIKFEVVHPATWQKRLGIPPRKKSEDRDQFKRRLKGHAEKLFPKVGVTLATCDALLIAHYAKEVYRR